MKIRDIQKSYNFREAVKKCGVPFSRRRIFVAPPMHLAEEKDIRFTLKYDEAVCVGPNDGDILHSVEKEIELHRKEHDNFKSWIDERKKLRQDLNKMGFNSSWYRSKTNKTPSEVRVYEVLTKPPPEEVTKTDIVTVKTTGKRKVSANHVYMLPYLDNPLPIALAIIADFLQERRLRLVDLFSNVDKNKDWMVTMDELRSSLKGTDILLTDAQLDDLIILVDVNNDGQMSYQELVRAVDVYYKDRRWQKLKEIYDSAVDTNESQESSCHRNSIDLLRLPRLEYREKIPELILRQRAREKRKERQRAKKRVTIISKEHPITTLSGRVGENKLLYMNFINAECERCIDLLHATGLNVKSDVLKKVLIPPNDHTVMACKDRLSSNRSVLPENHPLIRNYRRKQARKLKSLTECAEEIESSANESAPQNEVTNGASLPRVATIDYKNRAKEAKKLRRQRQCTSPTAFWPQHLLDKLYICMDDCGSRDGANAMFSRVR